MPNASLCRQLMIVSCFLLSACNSDSDLPSVLISPFNSCTLVSYSPTEELPRLPDDEGKKGERRAMIRYEVDCKPNISNRSDWYLPYRLQYQEIFTKTKIYPGGFWVWISVTRELYHAPDASMLILDQGQDMMGKNCLSHLNKLTTTALPCITAIDTNLGEQFLSSLKVFSSTSTYPLHAKGQTDLNAKLLERDERCLAYWHQIQHQLDNRFTTCIVK